MQQKKKTILVTGANGQLGSCFKKLASTYPAYQFIFASSEDLDLTSTENLALYFTKCEIDFCINCAAYTQVDQAEIEIEKAFLINAEAVKYLAETCLASNTTLIHFSTDYVFDGTAQVPYNEEAKTNPINTYGASKLKGETHIQALMEKYFIFRTSWLYSEFGHNFYKTILDKAATLGAALHITTEQLGTPTNANDLAEAVMQVIKSKNTQYGLYHYSNEGKATWYDFAKAILVHSGLAKNVHLQASGAYKTIAKRPLFSMLDKQKAIAKLNLTIPQWEESLASLQKTTQ